VDALAFDLKNLALASGEGSFTTRAQRHRGLQLMARELRALGYVLPGARSLKPKHIEALVTSWQAAGLSPGTMKNRMGQLRWATARLRKASIIPRDNAELGIPDRHAFRGNRAKAPSPAQLATLPERMQLVVRLQLAFGLRLEESLKFRVRDADLGDRIALQASWCKGGRAREVALVHPRQRALLDEVRHLCGDGSLVPDGRSYISFRREVESATRRAGIFNMHGHRHWYAQWRYQDLVGRPCPAAGGATYERLSRAERAADHRARLQISRELGHDRLQITDTYLGSRFAAKVRS
jgi:hypothetical protein